MFRSDIEALLCDPDKVVIQSVTDVNPELIAGLTSFPAHEKPKVKVPLQNASVTFTLPGSYLENLETFGARLFLWVVGPGGTFAPYSDFYARPALRKARLWRLGSDYHGGEDEFAVADGPLWSLAFEAPVPLTVARLMVVPYSHFSPYTVIATEEEGGSDG